ncbi:uncharacterized protein LOC110107194 [Dendrobium catenatum]|uniref:Uncharacterized protein n=1 Tax=Dendrobium catenatum TaxID=906689 RepID=A0A2I0V933_9ASPA|nr:uncharacterized protein LOC110107194 [Dendrobium catenatum]PKU59910.1 hypothetical protein MA16_Dca019612 [Dendrobium catenatum]
MEAFPVQFCRAVRSYWRRRRYERLEAGKRRKVKVAKLGGGHRVSAGSGLSRSFRLRRVFGIRSKMLSPVRLLARLRDAYVDSMLGLAGKGSGLSGGMGGEVLINRRIPKAHPVKLETGDFERRLILEICRSIRASGEIAVY